MSDYIPAEVHVFVTDHGWVRICPTTLAAMNQHFPGWRNPKAIKGRKRADRRARDHAKLGAKLLETAVFAMAQLAYMAEQELEQV